MIPARARGEQGVSLIAVIFFVVIMGFLGITLVSLMSTQTTTSASELSSTQALYLAEGGSEFGQRALAQNLEWYRSVADPIVTPAMALGAGTFAVSVDLPATMLSRRLVAAAPVPGTMRVFTTDRFPAAGFLQIDDAIGAGGEFVQYNGTTATTFTVIARNVAIGGVSGGAGTFARGTRVYPVTTLSAGLGTLGDPCTPTPSAAVSIAAHSKFLPAGTIVIDPEEIRYTGSTTAGGVMTLTGVTRCVNLTSSAHAIGDPVTPILASGTGTADFETFLTSTGTVGSGPLGTAVRVVQKTVQR